MSIFHLQDYKQVLRQKVKEFAGRRGVLAKMAEAAGCQRSYLSQVMNGHIHLTPDHALGLSGFLNFAEDETQYFMLLVDHARAGSSKLKERLQKQILAIRKRNSELENKITATIVHSPEETYLYYSSWVYLAVHMAVDIPAFQTEDALLRRLNISPATLQKVLHELEAMKLVARQGKRWVYAGGERHLSRKSPLVALHHNNWRAQAVLSSQLNTQDSYHYTTVSTMSRNDAQEILALLLKTTEDIRKTTALSPEEELVCLNMDFFKV